MSYPPPSLGGGPGTDPSRLAKLHASFGQYQGPANFDLPRAPFMSSPLAPTLDSMDISSFMQQASAFASGPTNGYAGSSNMSGPGRGGLGLGYGAGSGSGAAEAGVTLDGLPPVSGMLFPPTSFGEDEAHGLIGSRAAAPRSYAPHEINDSYRLSDEERRGGMSKTARWPIGGGASVHSVPFHRSVNDSVHIGAAPPPTIPTARPMEVLPPLYPSYSIPPHLSPSLPGMPGLPLSAHPGAAPRRASDQSPPRAGLGHSVSHSAGPSRSKHVRTTSSPMLHHRHSSASVEDGERPRYNPDQPVLHARPTLPHMRSSESEGEKAILSNGGPVPDAGTGSGTTTGAKSGRAGNKRRQKFTRTRTGCICCRKRRVKCDEGRPTCKRCVIAKRTCEYAEEERRDSDARDASEGVSEDEEGEQELKHKPPAPRRESPSPNRPSDRSTARGDETNQDTSSTSTGGKTSMAPLDTHQRAERASVSSDQSFKYPQVNQPPSALRDPSGLSEYINPADVVQLATSSEIPAYYSTIEGGSTIHSQSLLSAPPRSHLADPEEDVGLDNILETQTASFDTGIPNPVLDGDFDWDETFVAGYQPGVPAQSHEPNELGLSLMGVDGDEIVSAGALEESWGGAGAAPMLTAPNFLLPWFPSPEERSLILHYCANAADLMMAIPSGLNPMLAINLPLALHSPRGFNPACDALRVALLGIGAVHQAFLLNRSGISNTQTASMFQYAASLRDTGKEMVRRAVAHPEGLVSDATLGASTSLALIDMLFGGNNWQENFNMARSMIIARGGPAEMLKSSQPTILADGVTVSAPRVNLEILAIYEAMGCLTTGEEPLLMSDQWEAWWFESSRSTYEEHSVENQFGMSRTMVHLFSRLTRLLSRARRSMTIITEAEPFAAGPLSGDEVVLEARKLNQDVDAWLESLQITTLEHERVQVGNRAYAHTMKILLLRNVFKIPRMDARVQNAANEVLKHCSTSTALLGMSIDLTWPAIIAASCVDAPSRPWVLTLFEGFKAQCCFDIETAQRIVTEVWARLDGNKPRSDWKQVCDDLGLQVL